MKGSKDFIGYRAGGAEGEALADKDARAEGKKFDAHKMRLSLCPVSIAEIQLAATMLLMGRKPWCPELNLNNRDYLTVVVWCMGEMVEQGANILTGLVPVIEVLEAGAAKYGAWNWQLVDNAEERYTNAAWRHFLASLEEQLDPETNLPHLAHLAANCLFLHSLTQR